MAIYNFAVHVLILVHWYAIASYRYQKQIREDTYCRENPLYMRKFGTTWQSVPMEKVAMELKDFRSTTDDLSINIYCICIRMYISIHLTAL